MIFKVLNENIIRDKSHTRSWDGVINKNLRKTISGIEKQDDDHEWWF